MSKENDILRTAMSILGKRSAQKLTKKQRVERGRKAITARWNKQRNKEKESQ